MCRTAAEAFAAGWQEPCEHQADPARCPQCRLTAAEMARLAVLHRPHLAAPETAVPAAA